MGNATPGPGRLITMVLLILSVGAPAGAGPGISVLLSHDAPPYHEMLDGFKTALSESGIAADYQVLTADGDAARADGIADDAARREAALIYCLGTLACQSAQRRAGRRPVVAGLVVSPDQFRADAAAAGAFLTYSPETQLKWLKKLFPTYRRVGIIYNPRQNQALVDRAGQAAGQLGLELKASPIESPKELPAALRRLTRDVDILWALPDDIVLAPQTAKQLLLTSFKERIPLIGPSAPWVKGGALYSLGWDYADMGAQSAGLALKILDGVPIKDIGPAEPRRIGYSLNLKTAQHMNLDLVDKLIQDAKQVYR